MMSDASLQQLERDVEAARARLVSNLSTLCSPASFTAFKEDLKYEAFEAKDALIGKARSTFDGIVDDIKARAAANPAAVLAIGAGIAWRLIRHPPIATALIGTGLYSLLRTAPARDGSGRPVDYVAHARQRFGEQAGDLASAAKDQLTHVASAAKDEFTDAAGAVRERAVEMASTVGEQTTQLAEDAREKVQQWSDDARQGIAHASAQVQERAASAAQQTSAAFGDARQIAEDAVARASASARRQTGRLTREARQTSADLAARATVTAERASSSVQQAFNDQDFRDKILIGVAGLAVAAALGIAYQRRQDNDA
jgi:hypothetical protein